VLSGWFADALTPQEVSAKWPDCGWNCTAKDFDLNRAQGNAQRR
jgi:hypothetical protein